MQVTLIGKNTINKLNLPKDIVGSYWLKDKNNYQNILGIQAYNEKWVLYSNQNYKIVNAENVIINQNSISVQKNENYILEKVTLQEYNFYYIYNEISDQIYIVYCAPIYEDNYIKLQVKNTANVYVGGDSSCCHITYNNPFMNNVNFEIVYTNGACWIKNYDSRFNMFINDKPVQNSTQIINNGDRVFLFGLNLIFVNKEIFVNNPLGAVLYNTNYFTKIPNINSEPFDITENDFINENNGNYFLRTPRMMDVLDDSQISISAPKTNDKNKELPLALVLGSTLVMGITSIISLIQKIDNYNNGKTDAKSFKFSLMTSCLMLVTSLLIPLINRFYTIRIKKLNEKNELNKYKKYITNKTNEVEKINKYNCEVLNNTYVSAEECTNIILNNSSRLWERQIVDDDFLTLRLGMGNIHSGLQVSCNIPEDMDKSSELGKLMLECLEKSQKIENAPVLLSLVEKNILAIIGQNQEQKYKYIQNLLIQLITFQSYDELKLVFLIKENKDKKWNFVKTIPHVWSNNKKIRFFADEANGIEEICKYLSDIEKTREVSSKNEQEKNNTPYYLIITDDYKNIEGYDVINKLLKKQENTGFGFIFVTDDLRKLPNECQTFVEINEKTGILYETKNPNTDRLKFKINTSDIFFFNKINPILSNKIIKYNEEKEMQLPTSYNFLEMYNVGCIEQLNILERWKNSDSTVSLKAPIGIDGAGKIVSLDIHEKYHGPHGLIAGSTGSGKSEFIITYILSLALNYHPDDVTFVLIDYKGGGLAGAFKRPDMQLPHLVGSITNIDKSNLQRSLESIESELKRRQVKFNEAKDITGESTIDIYKYQKYYHQGVLTEPISHLFIISDEFAELKQQEPEFMDELISVARIGRSLGVHLILATQKPAGVVNDQIRSNSKFGVCLKVQSTSDSKDVIDAPDAAKLTRAGQFYLKVGNDDYMVLGQSGWAGAPYFPSNDVKKEYDNSIEFISNTGKILKKVDDLKKTSKESKGDQLTNLVKYICEIAKQKNIHETPLWLNTIPETIYLEDIRKKYNVKVNNNVIDPVIGEYDDPSKQLQNVMKLNLSNGGNAIIYGNAESGKETLISTMVYDIITNYTPDLVNMYILDFGSEALKIFKNAPHVGDVILANEKEKMARFFMMLQKELKERKELLSDYNGDCELYTKMTGKVLPQITVILNNYEVFNEAFPNTYDDVMEVLLREGTKYKFVFIFTASTTNALRYRTAQNFRQKIALQMNKDSDYSNIFEHLRKKRPAAIFGRGLVNVEEKKYFEFQTARICDSDNFNEYIKNEIEKQNMLYAVKAKSIPVVPELVTISDLQDCLTDLSKLPVGIAHKNIEPCLVNIKKNLLNIIIANNIEEYKKFIFNVIEELKVLPNVDFLVLDALNLIQDKKETCFERYVELFKKLNNAKKINDTVVVIIGLEKFIAQMNNEKLFEGSLQNAQELKKVSYIIFESANKLNNFSYSDWYKENVSKDTGIWLGNGVNEQYIMKSKSTSYRLANECGTDYGYVFTNGKPSLVKLVGMKENNEDNGEKPE